MTLPSWKACRMKTMRSWTSSRKMLLLRSYLVKTRTKSMGHTRTDDSLIYMDPHYCQSFVDVSTSHFPLQDSSHIVARRQRRCLSVKMDPSCTIVLDTSIVEAYERISQELSKVFQPSVKDKSPAFTSMQGFGRDYDLSAALTPEKREWPFIHNPRTVAATAGDFVLL
ncbi:cysteine protease ATG4C-like isoform X2 [Oncorhynchus kisutch]|uniref:cysteine protease ATG4C-like isoform X2 n=1 Tax=Oncorhynchus kisutch TaxID=8019 RepID=UPI0012DC24A3|nr:cysteine protease ATG4C-like isoform X2 [Oncorhynchus kisutch]